MAKFSFNINPRKVKKVSTKHRKIKTKIPVPESLSLLESLKEYESTNALIHLQAAQMIQSQDWNYDSIYEGYEMESFEEGKAIILSKINNQGTDRDGFDYANDDGNYIKFGGGVNYDEAVFTPTEMYLIDSKIDNGNAKNGKMIIKLNSEEDNNCSDTDGVFTTSNEDDLCMFLYKIDVLAPE